MYYTLWLNRKELVYELVFMRRGWGGNCVINITWMQISHFSNNAPVLHGPVKHLHVEAMLMWLNPASSNKVKVKTNNYNCWLTNMRPCSCQFKLVCEHAITDFSVNHFLSLSWSLQGETSSFIWSHVCGHLVAEYCFMLPNESPTVSLPFCNELVGCRGGVR